METSIFEGIYLQILDLGEEIVGDFDQFLVIGMDCYLSCGVCHFRTAVRWKQIQDLTTGNIYTKY